MNRDQMYSVLKNLTEDKAPASQINLLPAIQSRLQMSLSSQSKGIIMNKQTNSNSRRFTPAFIVLAIVLIGVIFFSLPEGRTMAQEIMHFFTRGESNVMPGPTATPVKWVEQTPGVSAPTFTPQSVNMVVAPFEASCGSYQEPHCSIDEIRNLVKYPIFALTQLPGDMFYAGATGGPDFVRISYQSPDQSGYLDIREEPYTGAEDQLNWQLGADADIQNVQIGSVSGEYVKGSYDGTFGTPTWNSDLDLQQLRWVNNGILFTFYMTGTNPSMDRTSLAALAETLTDGPVGESGIPVVKSPTPTSEPFDIRDIYPLSLSDVEALAGFKVLSPEKLPEVLSFVGASYDEKTKMVTLLYRYNIPGMPDVMDGLIIKEQAVTEGQTCDLCAFVRGKFVYGSTEDVVSEDAIIETVQVGSLSGQYLEGIGWVNATSDISGWEWASEPYRKRIRFEVNGLGVEVWADSYEMTKADLIAIAASLK